MTVQDFENNTELGKKVFEAVPNQKRPLWASTLLMTLAQELDNIPVVITELYLITKNENLWGKAHDQFTNIRTFSLENPDFSPKHFVYLAEKVAKITYNESGLPASFDHNSGWTIGLLAKRVTDHINKPEVTKEILKILLQADV